MTSDRFWKFTDVKVTLPRQAVVLPPISLPASRSSEPKHMAEAVDIGTDEDALRWAEEHDPETAELLKAEEVE